MALDNSNLIIEKELDEHAKKLEAAVDADVLAFVGPLVPGTEDALRSTLDGRAHRRPRLAVVLETEGGDIRVVERMVGIMRHYYSAHVEFYVPNYAMSAGTVLVMSGDAIYMDWYSVLGPIDPQVRRPGQTAWVPALGYLIKYQDLIEKSADPARGLTTAEMAFLVEKFDPAELYSYEQERELSIELLKLWLAKYKFKNWTTTRARHIPVTDAMKEAKAKEIAAKLNDTNRWHSHGRGITMPVLIKEFDLQIDDFSGNKKVADELRTYRGLLNDYMMRRRHSGVMHRRGLYLSLLGEE